MAGAILAYARESNRAGAADCPGRARLQFLGLVIGLGVEQAGGGAGGQTKRLKDLRPLSGECMRAALSSGRFLARARTLLGVTILALATTLVVRDGAK